MASLRVAGQPGRQSVLKPDVQKDPERTRGQCQGYEGDEDNGADVDAAFFAASDPLAEISCLPTLRYHHGCDPQIVSGDKAAGHEERQSA